MGADQRDEVGDGRAYLHLRMRPVCPPTYEPRGRLSGLNLVLVIVAVAVAVYFGLIILSLLAFALVAGDPG